MKNLKSVLLFIFALLPHFANSSTEQPRLDCPNGNIEVEEDAAVLLPCSVHPQIDVTDHMVDWRRVDLKKVVFCSQYGGHECDPDLHRSNRTTVNYLRKGNLTLQIHSAQLNDTGEYKCQVSGLPSGQISCKVNLSVVEKGTLKRDGFSAAVTATSLHKKSEAPGSGGGATKAPSWWATPPGVTVGVIIVIVGVIVIIGGVCFVRRNKEQGSQETGTETEMKNLDSSPV